MQASFSRSLISSCVARATLVMVATCSAIALVNAPVLAQSTADDAVEFIKRPAVAASWTLEAHAGAAAALHEAEGGVQVDVVAVGAEQWHVQLYQPGLTLQEGKTYALTFEIKASVPRSVGVVPAQQSGGEYTLLAPYQSIELTTQWQKVTIDMTPAGVQGVSRGPVFQLGNAPGSVFVRNVSLKGPGLAPPAALPGTFFPFALPLTLPDETAIDLRSMNDVPAGSKGRVIVRDGHFVRTDDNQRVRFWAINVGGPELFASSRQDITKVAKRLAQHGYNLVRLHHLDNNWDIFAGRSLWDRTSAKKVIDPKKLDQLHFAIAEFKKQGIYVNLNTKVSKELSKADGMPGDFDTSGDWTSGFPHQKRVDRFSRFFIEHQKEFARQLWTSTNPYTGQRLADDPAIAFAEINNENSLLSLWPGEPLGQGLEKLPKFFVDELTTLWNDWLRKKYVTHAAMMKSWGQPTLGLGTAVTDESTPWIHVFPGATQGTMQLIGTVDQGVLPKARFDITQTTGTDWHQQGLVNNIKLVNDQIYTLSFTASSTPARRLRISTDLSGGDYRNVGLNQVVELTPEPKRFELIFTANSPADGPGNRIALQLGERVGSVTIEGLTLRPGIEKSVIDASQSLDEGNVAINPSMSRAMRNDWIGFLADTDRAYSVEMRTLMRDEIGVKSLLADTQVEWGGITGFYREQDSDFIDTHSYYNHPQFGPSAWDPINWSVERSSLVVDFSEGNFATMGNLAAYRVAGKPFTVSEYDHPAPNDYRVEMYPLTSVVASLQNWDAIYVFAHGGWADEGNVGRINGFFDNAYDPAKFCFAPAAAILFRNNLIPQLRQSTILSLPDRPWEQASSVHGFWDKALQGQVNPIQRIYSVIPSGGTGAAVSPPVASDGKPVVHMETTPAGPVFVAANDMAIVLSGFVGGGTFATPAGTITINAFDTNFGSLMLVPMDNQPLASSKRMLLTIMSRAENTGMVWNSTRTSVGDQWGKAPSIVETFGGSIQLTAPAKSITPLNVDGTRGNPVAVQGAVKFAPADKAVWYEITR